MRRKPYILVALVFVSITFLFYMERNLKHILSTKNENLQLEEALSTITELQRKLRDVESTYRLSSKTNNKTTKDDPLNALSEIKFKLKDYLESNQNSSAIEKDDPPTEEHETLLRKINDDVVELLYSTESELQKLKEGKNEVLGAISRLSSQQRTILIDIEDLGKLDEAWRIKEAKFLEDLVRRRIEFNQNPKNCETAKQMICDVSLTCGFGCQVQSLVFCLMIAYGTQRTLIIESSHWNYEPKGWEAVFQPVSKTCTKKAAPGQSWKNGKDPEDVQVIRHPGIISSEHQVPQYIPLGIPEDLAPRLKRLHGNPAVWWIGQITNYLLRPQEWLQQEIEEAGKSLGFKKPVVGIHVRRTDKLHSEASYHSIEEYMKHVEAWYEKYELRMSKEKSGNKTTRRVYLASDDVTVLPEAKQKYPQYEFVSDLKISESADPSKRYTRNSLRGLLIDIFLLSKCNYFVCTLSSQICRVASSLMQNHHADASSLVHSLDDIFYYGVQYPHVQKAMYDHKAKPGNEEIDMLVGDIIGIQGNHWDGFSKGRNHRTNQRGLYPSHKVKEIVKVIKYPTYPEVPLKPS